MNKETETNKKTEDVSTQPKLEEAKKKNEWVACLYYKPPESSNTTDDLTRSELKEMIEKREFTRLFVVIEERISPYSYQPQPVGKVVEAYQAEDGSVYIRFQLDSDTGMGRSAIDCIGKTLHEVDIGALSRKILMYVILCEKSAMPRARILADGKKFLD